MRRPRRPRRSLAPLAALALLAALAAGGYAAWRQGRAARPPAAPPAAAEPGKGQAFDILILGGTVYDGTGAPPRRADVGIRGDRIAAVGDLRGATAARVIDAAGLAVAPGFIDPHSHTYEYDDPYSLAAVMQGITTQLGGVDGRHDGYVPVEPPRPDRVGDGLAWLASRGTGVNQGLFAGFGTLRRQAMGGALARPATPEELRRMQDLLRQDMAAGAFGLSTGLEYAPQPPAPTEEVVAVARVAAEAGGVYATHIRHERTDVQAGVQEALDIGREAGIPVAIQHFKFAGPENWPRFDATVARIRQAVAAGQPVLADVYSYLAPDYALHQPVGAAWVRYGAHPDILVIEQAPDPLLVGRTLAEAARAAGVSPAALADSLDRQGARVTVELIRPDHLRRLLAEDWVAVSSDGEAAPVLPPEKAVVAGGGVHPRSYGNYPRLLRLNREEGWMPLERLIRKMTGQVADFYRIRDRGYLRPGAYADVVVFDPAQVAERATWWDPQQYPVGIRTVLVNGAVAVDGGQPTRVKAGRPLRRGE